MAFEFTIADGLAVVTFHGQVSPKDLQQLSEQMAKMEAELAVSPHRLSDLSLIDTIELDFETLAPFAAIRRRASVKNKVRSAILASRALHYGFARMFQTLNDNPNIEIRIFSSRETALTWLTKQDPAVDGR